jgi:hypothetical protein
MITTNPDKYIRKAIFDLLNDIVVSGKTIKCFDSRITGNAKVLNYILLTTQTKSIDKANKCEYRWNTSVLIEIFTKTSSQGNSGSRVLLNDIEQAVNDLLLPEITIDNFDVVNQNLSYNTQLETITDTENIYRSFLTLELTLN